MSEWWSSFGAFEQTYFWIAIIATGIFAIVLILTFFADADTDTDFDADEGMGFQFITFKNLVGFFAVLGWTGLSCINSGYSNGTTIIISFIAGLIMMSLMALLFFFMTKLTDNGTLEIKNAINGMGEVYLTIPANRSAFGKVQIRIQGTLRELDAVTDNNEAIKTGSLITVTDVINGEILVVKSNQKS
jgi:hypothetical protein